MQKETVACLYGNGPLWTHAPDWEAGSMWRHRSTEDADPGEHLCEEATVSLGLLWESRAALEMVVQYRGPDSNQCDVLNCMLLTIKKMKTKMHLNGTVHSQKYKWHLLN